MVKIFGTNVQETWSFASDYEQYALHMGAGIDVVIDRSLTDSNIFGGAGNDILQTYAGSDKLHGGIGDDFFFVRNTGEAHQVEIWGGKGRDSVLIESDSAALADTKLENGDEIILFVNGMIATLHGVENVHMVQHSDIPSWV